ncbi:YesL family protein [Gracilibacillus salinarum]|uniref:YesL family protein n=1 Tax=Gracilibacillus salinarum TaxID=2932255 RepID=A0ABY4GM52_9BACI|nr:YesL family protein [Gracilibacillus salinarum]UOQ85266.1 YesL family protein [Gracilibacillus salinarum]
MSALNKACEWIAKVAYLNLLWVGLSMSGLIIAGLFPATAATFAVVRKWLTGYSDISITKTFWQTYRQSFLGANVLGYLFVVVAYILYLDFLFINVAPNDYVLVLTIPFLFVSILLGLTFLYVFPVYVHFEMNIRDVIKSAFFIMVLNPGKTIMMTLGVFGIIAGIWKFQGLALFFSMSLLAIASMFPALRAFSNINGKKNYLKNKNVYQ